MVQSVYIVKLYPDLNIKSRKFVRNNDLESSVEGCAIVLGFLGLLSLVFGSIGLMVEIEANSSAGGLWAGVVCLGIGVDKLLI